MVDVISDGRMILGCGIGNFEPEFELYGLTKKGQGKRFEEAIDLVQRAWAGEDIEQLGPFGRIAASVKFLLLGAP